MKDPDPKMKNDELSTSNVINQTWALKGKRKRIPSGKVRSNGNIIGSVPSGSHTTTKPKEKGSSSERAPTKEKDRKYNECDVCDLGGDLLCCDRCTRSYHIGCLDPPLERIPNGKWKCPSCCLKNNLAERVVDADPTSKRAKLKITIKKSKSKIDSTKNDKNGKKRSSKWKSEFSITDVDVSGSSSSDDKKEKQTDEEANVNHSHEKKVVLGAGSSKKKSSKRKCEDPSDNGKKKPRTDKGKKPADGSQKSEAKAHLDSSSSPVKRKSVRHLKIKSVSKDDKGLELREKKLKDEVSEEVSNSSPESGKAGNGEIQNFGDLSQFHQVDRVLGCRIQVNEIDSGHHHSATEAHSTSSQSPIVADKHIGQLEETSKCSGSDIADAETISEGTGNILTPSNTQRLTRDCGEENITDLAGRSMDEDTKRKDDTALTLIDLAKPAEEIPRGDNTNCASNSHELVDDQIEVEANHSHKIKDSSVAGSLPRDRKMVSYEYLVKWVGKSHLHNSWVSESQLKVIAKRKYDNYNYKYGKTLINISEERWKLPQRVIAKYGSEEVFVKWTGLPYEECTWETITEPLIAKFSHLIDLFDQFERRTLEKDAADYETVKEKSQFHHSDVVTLTEQPKELGGSLFPHQLEALNWLRKCWSKSKNVILADEMGLGKTISACAFLSSLCFEFKARLPCLVLVPLSTMPNWMAEFSLWAPNINVVEYHGCAKARALMREYEWHANDPVTSKKTSSYKFNVLLTTYEMVLADSTHLSKVPWEVLIVDEGHRLKNSGSKLFSLLNTFSFQHRVLLTGTPLQNNLGEMYNLLNFLQPSSFPSLKSFEDKFRDLTTAEKVDELKKLVAPHMLRRLKKDAMQNIPPKTERVVPVDLSTIQAEYYRAMLTKNYQVLRNVGKGVPQQSMLNIVMQLRKVCNHPYLIQGTEPESGTVEFLHDMRIKASAKLALLHTMLKILHKEGHRVLIFSQMTKLLDILEDYLNIEFGPKTFERVDGSVSIADRQMAIARFNQDKSRFVFLLSTRACGLGINLASADTVIIYDSDFNPHADIQAMNRAHRIGQSKRLLVYRLVVRASVEERILQLAKKKLMLDHLFVNKTGSQKEVEDILKWGTEQLFNDSSKDLGEQNENKREGSVDSEHKNKRRVGGLGDVYQDKCTEGSTQIVWDEAAILKLLDRSIIDSVSTDNAEGDMENDMLGSVKSLDWNDEPIDEQVGTESSSAIIDGTTAQNLEKEEDNSENVTDENEWDRLLRVRWEKYQNEEEAALGRGKRVKKAVQYREAYAPQPTDTSNQNGAKVETEPEPEREYTPAGKALKTKFAKLRARQKDRLARMKTLKESLSSEGQNGMAPIWPPTSDGQNNDQEDKPTQTSVPITSKTDPNIKTTKGKEVDESRRLLPVLGLCAPNAKLMESAHRNSSRSFIRHGKQQTGHDFPFNLASPSGGPSNETAPAKARVKFRYPDIDSNALQHQQKIELLSSFAPMSSADLLHHRPEMMTFPNLPFDMTKLTSQEQNASHSQSDLFPGLTLGRLLGDFPSIPGMPKLRYRKDNHQEMDARPQPMLDLGQMLPTNASLPENHRKVLEDIMMRAGPGSSNQPQRKLVKDYWSEDELDFLWVGVRRHGRGGWNAMLEDPKLRFSRFRLAEDLAARWEEEQLKILGAPVQKHSKATKSPVFPGISDGMMRRALHKSRFAGGPEPHSMEMNVPSPNERPNPHGFQNEHFVPFPTWALDRLPDNLEQHLPNPFLLGSLGLNGLGLFNSQQKEGLKMPNFLDHSGNIAGSLKRKDETGGSSGGSSETKLPHWLRKVVVSGSSSSSGSPVGPPEPVLPPTVSAIAESVRLLYKGETPTIPPFVPPGLPPSQPKDPRQIFKKRRHSHGLSHQSPLDLPGSSHQPQQHAVGSTSGAASVTEPDLNVPPPVDHTEVDPPTSNPSRSHSDKVVELDEDASEETSTDH